MPQAPTLANRFRGFYPVVVDVETGGFNAQTDALLEIAAVTLRMDGQGMLHPAQRLHYHVEPFPGANLEKAALEFTGIDPYTPLRGAVAEDIALRGIHQEVRRGLKEAGCNRAVLVGHNAFFDHSFLKAASLRCDIKRDPFHPFSSFDTASLAGLIYGQTVLARACEMAGIPFNQQQAHSALYDATRTAELFCSLVNRFRILGGWPPPPPIDMPPTLFDANSEL
jgi:ribonuclease T